MECFVYLVSNLIICYPKVYTINFKDDFQFILNYFILIRRQNNVKLNKSLYLNIKQHNMSCLHVVVPLETSPIGSWFGQR